MTVTFVFNNTRELLDNIKLGGSEYVTNLLKDFEVEDIEIQIPTDYEHVITNYIHFLNGEKRTIYHLRYLFIYFFVSNYFADDNYFHYLMGETYNVWSGFYSYILLFPEEIQRNIYLLTPYEFIP